MADIRTFFQKKGSTTAAARGSGRGQTKRKAAAVIISDDEDDDFKPTGPKAKPATAKIKHKRSRPRIQYDSDSDETPQTIPKQTSQSTTKSSTRSSTKSTSLTNSTKSTSSTNSTRKVKEVSSVSAFFGSAPVKRSNQPAVLTPAHNGDSKSRKTSGSSSPSVVPESPTDGIVSQDLVPHGDNAFVKTLEQLDHFDSNPSSSTSTLVPAAKKLKKLVDKAAVPTNHSNTATISTPSTSPSPAVATDAAAAVQSTPPKQLKTKSLSPPLITPPPPLRQNSASSHTTPQRKSSSRTPPQRKSSSRTPPPSRRSSSSSRTPPVLSPVQETTQQQPTPPASLAQRSSNYRAYLNRGGPRAPGSKEIPVGAENCLDGLTFVFTGVLESIERDDAADLVKRYGGRVTGNISKKTSYVVLGEGAGESKMSKARQLGTKQISEDELLELVRTRPPKTTATPTRTNSKQGKRRLSSSSAEQSSSSSTALLTNSSSFYSPKACAVSLGRVTKEPHPPTTPTSSCPSSSQASMTPTTPRVAMDTDEGPCSLMWVDRYRPKTTKQIIGQQGDKSCVNKLKRWLRDWHMHREREKGKTGSAATRKGWNDDGTLLKAALLSGPPGVGKTTSATLVCQEQGYSFTELNASATRSKKSLQEHVSTQLSNLAMDGFLTGGSGSMAAKRHALIMDEVDGMAGNEDRGGVQELIQLIKTTRIPIICICNDRQHPKIRSLSNYCLDLRFHKPRLEQIKGPMRSIAYKEGVTIAPQALHEVIAASGHDIRQVLHNLSVWTATSRSLTYDDAKSSAQNARKEMKQSPFEVIRTVFMPMDGGREMSFTDKSDLFFKDYSLGPLFVQENYPNVKLAGKCNVHQALHRLSSTADAIACGDIVSTAIRSSSSYGLLPVQAVFSSVIPGEFMRGYLGKPEFPVWLGNYSKTNRSDRLLQELRQHTRLSSSSDKLDFGMHYLPYLQQRLTRPLIRQEGEGVAEVVSVMQAYNLVRDDWDTVNELAHYSSTADPTNQIASKVKAAFTRTLNKECHALPYSVQSGLRKRSRPSVTDDPEEIGEYSDQEEEDEDISRNSMVKVKRVLSSDTGGGVSKGRGKGPAKGSAKPKAGKTKK